MNAEIIELLNKITNRLIRIQEVQNKLVTLILTKEETSGDDTRASELFGDETDSGYMANSSHISKENKQ